jgi:hypothetical protein
MIVMSFRSKKDKKQMLKKAKEMEEYVTELIECLEDAESRDEWEDEDYDYSERSGGMTTRMRGRYGYGRK